jgi:LppP/LprE lipoprotein
MRRLLPALLALAVLLAGCGSQTKTVTVASAPPSTGTTTSTTAPPTTSTTTTTTETTAPSSTGSTTHTAPEPAFTETVPHPESANSAAAVLRERGYTPDDLGEYHADQALRVLVGTRQGSPYAQQVFFFLQGHYLGTDTKEPSARLRVVSQSDTEIAIAYSLYRHGDSPCCPGGGQQVVHFALNDGKLTALDPIPPASSSAALSRN